MEDLFRTAEEELAEFEFMEFGDRALEVQNSGDTAGSGGGSSSRGKNDGSSGGIVDSLFEEEEDHKRNK